MATNLAPAEQRILDALREARGAPVAREVLDEAALNPRAWEDGSDAVKVWICHIRRKLGRDAILTVRGIGYALGEGYRDER